MVTSVELVEDMRHERQDDVESFTEPGRVTTSAWGGFPAIPASPRDSTAMGAWRAPSSHCDGPGS